MQGSRSRALATVASVCAIGCASSVDAGTTTAWAGASPSSYASMLNAERASHGLAPLRISSDLVAIAQEWSAHMAGSQTLAHNPGLTSLVHNWRAVGENVGEGPTIEDLDSAFMNSAEHRANILDPSYREFGVGYATNDGIIWITIDFRDPMTSTGSSQPTPTSARAPQAASAPAVTDLPPSNMLQWGSAGPKVARVQRILGVEHDGLFGPRTHRAVARFQHHHHLAIDGVVGPKTRSALRRFEHNRQADERAQRRLIARLVVWLMVQ